MHRVLSYTLIVPHNNNNTIFSEKANGAADLYHQGEHERQIFTLYSKSTDINKHELHEPFCHMVRAFYYKYELFSDTHCIYMYMNICLDSSVSTRLVIT